MAVAITNSTVSGHFSQNWSGNITVSGDNTLLLVIWWTSDSKSYCNYNGSAMTLLYNYSSYSQMYVHYVVNPTSGTHAVAVSDATSGNSNGVYVACLSGVDQANPFGTVVHAEYGGGGSSLSVDATSTSSSDMVWESGYNGGSVMAGQTGISGMGDSGRASYKTGTNGTVTMGRTGSSNQYGIFAFNIKFDGVPVIPTISDTTTISETIGLEYPSHIDLSNMKKNSLIIF